MNNKEVTGHNLHLLIDDQLDATTKKNLLKEIEVFPELQRNLKKFHK